MTEFQRSCIEAVLPLVDGLVHETIHFNEIQGETENYYLAKVPHSPHPVSIYVYLDEAGFGVEGKDWNICERSDYKSDADLIKALIEKLTAYFA